MGLCQSPEIFDSALARHLYDNPHHFILLDNTSIIVPVKDVMQVFRDAMKIEKPVHQKVALNGDT